MTFRPEDGSSKWRPATSLRARSTSRATSAVGARTRWGCCGYGHTDDLFGAGKTPDVLPDVELGGAVAQIVAGGSHACALLDTGDVRCWGLSTVFELGTSDQERIGDNEVPGSRSPVQLGSKASFLSTSDHHTCAIIEGGFVRCWGPRWGTSRRGPLGQGGSESIGDDETPAQAGNVNVGGSVSLVGAGKGSTCALLSGGRLRCWGIGGRAKSSLETLGYQETEDIGDDETPASAGNIDLGGEVAEVAMAGVARCGRLTSGAVRCWGRARTFSGVDTGVLGYGDGETIGDNETPASAGDVPIGGLAVQLSTGSPSAHMCALLMDGALRCWGSNNKGELGLGHTDRIGDNETPADVDPVRVLE